MALEKFTNNAQTITTGSVNNSSDPVSITVSDASKFPSTGNFRIIIDSEILLVTAVSSNTFTCSRAQEGTTIATHASGATVTHILTAQALKNIISEYNIYDTLANKPTAAVAGRLYFPTDGPGIYFRDDGSAWKIYANGFGPFTPPLSDFTTNLNFSTRGSVTTTDGYVKFNDAGPAANAEFIMARLKTAPSTPWTMTVAIRANGGVGANFNCGIIIRDSSTSRLKALARAVNSTGVNVWSWSNATTFNTTHFTGTGDPRGTDLVMLQLNNDGTNLNYRISYNFKDWLKIYSETLSGNYIATIDQVGFYMNMLQSPDTNNCPANIDVLHAATT